MSMCLPWYIYLRYIFQNEISQLYKVIFQYFLILFFACLEILKKIIWNGRNESKIKASEYHQCRRRKRMREFEINFISPEISWNYPSIRQNKVLNSKALANFIFRRVSKKAWHLGHIAVYDSDYEFFNGIWSFSWMITIFIRT